MRVTDCVMFAIIPHFGWKTFTLVSQLYFRCFLLTFTQQTKTFFKNSTLLNFITKLWMSASLAGHQLVTVYPLSSWCLLFFVSALSIPQTKRENKQKQTQKKETDSEFAHTLASNICLVDPRTLFTYNNGILFFMFLCLSLQI